MEGIDRKGFERFGKGSRVDGGGFCGHRGRLSTIQDFSADLVFNLLFVCDTRIGRFGGMGGKMLYGPSSSPNETPQ